MQGGTEKNVQHGISAIMLFLKPCSGGNKVLSSGTSKFLLPEFLGKGMSEQLQFLFKQ